MKVPEVTASADGADPPLSLCRVLEEEYESLHGPLTPDYPAAADDETRLAALFSLIHALPHKRSALCLSGGGIRSATFSLGLMQGLAQHRLLTQFDYLSTVSGGGYIGSWLSAWIHRHPEGIAGVERELSTAQSSRLEPEPAPIRHLRAFSNYLSPKSGFFSADSWTLIAIYLRNLLLNWLVIVPLLLATLAVPRLLVALLLTAPPPWAIQGALGLGFFLAVLGITFVGVHRPSLNRYRSGQRAFLRWCLLPLVGSAVALAAYWYWIGGLAGAALDLPAFLVFGVAARLSSWAIYAGLLRRRRAVRELPMALAIGSLGGALFWVVASTLFPDPAAQVETYASFVVPLLLATYAVTATIFIGLTSHASNDVDPEWWARFGGWMLIVAVAWCIVYGIVVYGPLALLALPARAPGLLVSLGSLSGAVLVAAGRSSSTPGSAQASAAPSGWQTTALEVLEALAAPVFTVALITMLSLATNWLLPVTGAFAARLLGVPPPAIVPAGGHMEALRTVSLESVALFMGAMASLGVVLALLVDINKLSLHSMYRSRLIRAYLGASRDERDPNPFTGFDQEDDIPIHQLVGTSRSADPDDRTQLQAEPNAELGGQSHAQRPMHVVNITLNVVSGTRRAWQQRKAESFVATPLHCGSRSLGFRSSSRYGGSDGMSLGTAIAISGAAASPNVGYNSSPFVAFLLALFNARLGWWLGNPGEAGQGTYRAQGPLLAVSPLIQEAFGLINERCPYVFLSDGGHYENLGLYEMVLRRSHLIVVSDAGRDIDYTFESLGNAIRKVRIDLGIPIDFESIPIYSKQRVPPIQRADGGAHSGRSGQDGAGDYCAIGRIRYSAVDGPGTDGVLVYLKPAVYGGEPADVYHYSQANPGFPQESTSDQWFSESQFESYRMLGLHTARKVCRPDSAGGGLVDLVLGRSTVEGCFPSPADPVANSTFLSR